MTDMTPQSRKTYAERRASLASRFPKGEAPGGIGIDDILQLQMQNTYNTHLDIAREMARVMRADMAAYDAAVADPASAAARSRPTTVRSRSSG